MILTHKHRRQEKLHPNDIRFGESAGHLPSFQEVLMLVDIIDTDKCL